MRKGLVLMFALALTFAVLTPALAQTTTSTPSSTTSTTSSTTSTTSSTTSTTSSTTTSTTSTTTTSLPPEPQCLDPIVPIYDIQGSGSRSPLEDHDVETEGVVTGIFDGEGQLGGFFVQDPFGDGDPKTSDGIFVRFEGASIRVNDYVRVFGVVDEFFGETRINADKVLFCAESSIDSTPVQLPLASADDFESFEGMLVTFLDVYATDTFNLHRFGEAVVSVPRLCQVTNFAPPGPLAADDNSNSVADIWEPGRFVLDDGRSDQFNDPIPYLGANNTLRLGDHADMLTGNLGFGFSEYRLQPTEPVTFRRTNPRPAAPAAPQSIRVMSFNVFNYWTTIDDGVNGARGADSVRELGRQRDKLVDAILMSGAHIVGLQELENNGATAVAHLVAGLNTATAPGTWAFTPDPAYPGGIESTNAIKVGFIYQTAVAKTIGDPVADDDPIFATDRPPIAQTFRANGENFTVIVNHFKSKSSRDATGPDEDQGDGQGAFNARRTQQAKALLDFVAELQTSTGDPDVLVLGDFNAYQMEDPITELEKGLTNLIDPAKEGICPYSFVFFGQAGLLDYAFASNTLSGRVTDTTIWHINSDEPRVLDYNDDIIDPAERSSDFNQESVFNPDKWRSSDHDPVIVDLALVETIDSIGMFDPATGRWHLRKKDGSTESFFYGNPGDQGFMGDWDCDGVDTPGVLRNSDNMIFLSNRNGPGVADISFLFGNPGDRVVAGDPDGDGCDTVNLFRPSEGVFYIINKLGESGKGLGAADFSYAFGKGTDNPYLADFNDDGVDSPAVHDPATGQISFRNSNSSGAPDGQFIYGNPGDIIVFGKWASPDTVGAFRPSNATWFLRFSNTAGVADLTIPFGEGGFTPVTGFFAI